MTESKEITVLERAQLALKPAANEQQLTELATQSKSITEITNVDGLAQAHRARMTLKNTRVEIAKIGKAARDDATQFSKAVIAEEKRLIAIIEPEEKRLEGLQNEWESARAAEKKARDDAERARVQAIQAKLGKLSTLPEVCTSEMAPSRLVEIIQQLEAPPTFDYQEFTEEATALRQKALVALRAAHVGALERVEREEQEARDRAAEQERMRQEREELDRQRAEQARVTAIQDRIQALRGHQALSAADSVAVIERAIETLSKTPVDESYQEFRERAAQIKSEELERLAAILDSAKAHHAEQARLAAQRAEQDRIAREQADRQAEIDRREREQREAEEKRAAAEKVERERRSREEEARRQQQAIYQARCREVEAMSAADFIEALTEALAVSPAIISVRIAEIPHEEWMAVAANLQPASEPPVEQDAAA